MKKDISGYPHIQYLPDDNRESFWSGEFRKIFIANLALNNVEKVEGPEQEKAIIKAGAAASHKCLKSNFIRRAKYQSANVATINPP